MFNLLFSQRTAAKQSIEQLENLVAILTQRSGPAMLHVYHSANPPESEDKNITVIPLRDLPTYDLNRFDGLLIGFNVLDVLRGDLTTKGPNFYPIERIFMERGETGSLYRTMIDLSIDLMRLRETGDSSSSGSGSAAEAKALQTALPGMLSDRDCAGLVAILPVGELNRFIARKTCHYLYYDAGRNRLLLDDPLLNTRSNWVIGLEELALLCPDVQPDSPQFIDLRAVLRSMQREEALQATRRGLAWLFYELQRQRGAVSRPEAQQQAYRQTAWALAIEYWLAQIECEDLVAFCPHSDFERFLETGDSIRVYRSLESSGSSLFGDPQPGGQPANFPVLNQSLHDVRLRPLPDGYGVVIFALPGVYDLICPPAERHSERTCGDLCKILYKAGCEKLLARSLWLLSHDLLRGALPIQNEPAEMRKMVLDACSRACLIYNLSDPWEWRQGRWQIYLKGVYQTRQQLLQQAMLQKDGAENSATLENYFQALSLWYGCATADHPEKNLEAMLEKLHDFQREVHGSPFLTETFGRELLQSNDLRAIGECLLNQLSDDAGLPVGAPMGGPADESEPPRIQPRETIPSLLRQAADLSQTLPLISPHCKQAADQLLAARRKRQLLYTQERGMLRLIDQMQKLLADLRNKKRQFFIPIHEEKALVYAYDQEIRAVEVLLQWLESSAKLTVVLKNTWVDIHQPVHLTLEITNRGRVEANALEVVLDQPHGLQLLDSSPVREIAALPPDMPNPIDYYILPEKVGAELRLEYSFSDPSGQRHKDTWTTHLNVRSLDTQPFQIKVNRYQFGRPIQNMSEFYGRRSELQNILSLLQAGGKQNLLLRGPRRMGKTSLLYMLKIAITEPAARRFFDIPTQWDAELNRVHPVFLSLHSFNLLSGGDATSQFFRTLLERIAGSLDVEPAVQAEMIAGYERREEVVGSVNAALEQINGLLNARPNQRIAVLLDEYDEVYQPGTGSLDRHLREFVSAEQRLTWIIASTLGLFHEVKTISSPWFNLFMILELGRLTEKAAEELVEVPTHAENIFWRSDAILALLKETGRHPAFTQLFCGRVIAYLNQVRTNYVLQETIYSIADQIVDEQETANNHFEYFWQDTGGLGQLILLILDNQDHPLKRDEIRLRLWEILRKTFGSRPRTIVQEEDEAIEWQEREFKSQIDWVEKITNAVFLDLQKRSYSFTVPLFQRWLRRRRQYQNLEAETLAKIAREMENDGIHADQS